MRKTFTPFVWFVGVVALAALIEGFSLLGVHVVSQAYGGDHCAALFLEDASRQNTCRDYEETHRLLGTESFLASEKFLGFLKRVRQGDADAARELQKLLRKEELKLLGEAVCTLGPKCPEA